MYKYLPILIGLTIGLIAAYLDLTYIAFGVLVGLALNIFQFEKESRKAIAMGLTMIVLSLIAFGYAWYVSAQHNLSFAELSQHTTLPDHMRAIPFFAVAFLTAGLTDILHYVLIDRDKENVKKS